MMHSRSDRSREYGDAVIDISGVKTLQSTLDYINFLESERSRCYKELEDNETCIARLKQSNIELTQKVVRVQDPSARIPNDWKNDECGRLIK
ncbi:TPA: hypothetical protein ACG07D_000829 [Streptococcus pyogenes]